MADGLDYTTARLGFRAPRVAIVFDGGTHWHHWARVALYVASRTWGGAGFIVIPHIGGEVSEAMCDLTRAYDPDYVVSFRRRVADVELLEPGTFAMEAATEGGPCRADVIANLGDRLIADPVSLTARQSLAQACSPFVRELDAGDTTLMESIRGIDLFERSHGLLGADDAMSGKDGALGYLSAPNDVGGARGVALASAVGQREEPRVPVGPAKDQTARPGIGFYRWLLDPQGNSSPPEELYSSDSLRHSVPTSALPRAWDLTLSGLASVVNGSRFPRQTLISFGDSAESFALAHAWDVMYGHGVWLPAAWLTGDDADDVSFVLHHLAFRAGSDSTQLLLRPDREAQSAAETVAEVLRRPDIRVVTERGKDDLDLLDVDSDPPREVEVTHRDDAPPDRTTVVDFPRLGLTGHRHFAIIDQFNQQVPLPVTTTADGGVEMRSSGPIPALSDLELAGRLAQAWIVDYEFPTRVMPTGHHLRTGDLLGQDENPYLTWVRSTRHGLSYEAGRFDFVATGTPALDQLVRPRLRELGMIAWARTVAGHAGYTCRLSNPGQLADVVTQMWGTRSEAISDFGGDVRRLMHCFQRTGTKTSSVFPDGEGCVLAGQAYLHFEGLAQLNPGASKQTLRTVVDRLLRMRVLQRGLILRCPACLHLGFYQLSALAQITPCARCSTPFDLSSPNWGGDRDNGESDMRAPEPLWFYDLHNAVRRLLTDHGDVPLLLAHHLRSTAGTYGDTAEIELVRQGKSNAETDLLASADRTVIVAEAKISSSLGANKREVLSAARKRVLAAQVFGAEHIVLATTAPAWDEQSVQATRDAVDEQSWTMSARPRVRVISRLGKAEVEDRML